MGRPKKKLNDTSYYGIDINASVNGNTISNEDKNKPKQGNVFTIFDWKDERPISKDELLTFNISVFHIK